MPLTPWEGEGEPGEDVLPPPFIIKWRLPVLRYEQLRKLSPEVNREPCTVCFVGMEDGDEVRKLGNCSHAFHKGCMDQWIEVGQESCPLCRAKLLPAKVIATSASKNSLH